MSLDKDKRNVALAQLVRDIQDNWLAHVELSRLQARLKRERYVALVAAGFTEQQALTLCENP